MMPTLPSQRRSVLSAPPVANPAAASKPKHDVWDAAAKLRELCGPLPGLPGKPGDPIHPLMLNSHRHLIYWAKKRHPDVKRQEMRDEVRFWMRIYCRSPEYLSALAADRSNRYLVSDIKIKRRASLKHRADARHRLHQRQAGEPNHVTSKEENEPCVVSFRIS